MLKIPKGPRHKQVEVLLQGMRSAQACLRLVQAEKMMLIGLGTIGRHMSKLPDEYSREWYCFLDKHSEEDHDVVFQLWMDREGRWAVRQMVEQMSTQLVHGQAGGAGALGTGAQR